MATVVDPGLIASYAEIVDPRPAGDGATFLPVRGMNG